MPSAYAKPLPRRMVDEAKEFQRLFREHITTTGTLQFYSLSSGVTYTSTTGQSGLFRLLAFTLRDYIISLDKPVYDLIATITATGSWTVPTGVEYVTAWLVTGGKTGYSAPWTDVLLVEDLPVTPGATISCTVGGAGGDIASRTTTFGDKTVTPTSLIHSDLSHFYNPYDNIFYCPYFITDDMFPDEMDLPLGDYPVKYPTTYGADGFVGAPGEPGKDQQIDLIPPNLWDESMINGGNGGDGYIGGPGGSTYAMPSSGEEDPGATGAHGGNGGIGHNNGQGGNGGKGGPHDITDSNPLKWVNAGRGGDGGDGGNGGNGGDGGGEHAVPRGNVGILGPGGNGGNALRYGGTGGSAGLSGYGTTTGTPGAGKAGAILIFTEHRETGA